MHIRYDFIQVRADPRPEEKSVLTQRWKLLCRSSPGFQAFLFVLMGCRPSGFSIHVVWYGRENLKEISKFSSE